jgi:hypothetical protein
MQVTHEPLPSAVARIAAQGSRITAIKRLHGRA